MFDEVFKELESLVYLPPLPSLLLHESGIYAGHNFIEVLEAECPLRNLLHQRRARAPGIVVGSLPDLGLHLAHVEDDVLGLVVHAFDVIEGNVLKSRRERLKSVHGGRNSQDCTVFESVVAVL